MKERSRILKSKETTSRAAQQFQTDFVTVQTYTLSNRCFPFLRLKNVLKFKNDLTRGVTAAHCNILAKHKMSNN